MNHNFVTQQIPPHQREDKTCSLFCSQHALVENAKLLGRRSGGRGGREAEVQLGDGGDVSRESFAPKIGQAKFRMAESISELVAHGDSVRVEAVVVDLKLFVKRAPLVIDSSHVGSRGRPHIIVAVIKGDDER